MRLRTFCVSISKDFEMIENLINNHNPQKCKGLRLWSRLTAPYSPLFWTLVQIAIASLALRAISRPEKHQRYFPGLWHLALICFLEYYPRSFCTTNVDSILHTKVYWGKNVHYNLLLCNCCTIFIANWIKTSNYSKIP